MIEDATAYVITWAVASALIGMLLQRWHERRDRLSWKQTIVETCRCGMWEKSAYGPECPSCRLKDHF
jgi:hypothetical protein